MNSMVQNSKAKDLQKTKKHQIEIEEVGYVRIKENIRRKKKEYWKKMLIKLFLKREKENKNNIIFFTFALSQWQRRERRSRKMKRDRYFL